MANKILVKRSAVTSNVPTTAQLELGEIAINTYDGKMFIKKDNGTASIVEISGGGGGGGSGTVTSASVVSANGFAGTVATATSTPAITLTTSVTGIIKGNGTALSAAIAADFPTLNQSTTGSAATLTTPRAIYGNNFDGSVALTQIIASTYGGTGNGFSKFSGATTSEKTYTLPNASTTILTTNSVVTEAQGGTGTGTYTTGDILYASASNTLSKLSAGTVNYVLTSGGAGVAPSWAVGGGSGTVTSVGFTGGIISVATPTTTPALTVAGTSGGIPYFSSASTWATSAALSANALVQGGGAGVAPSTITTGTGVITALGVNTGSVGSFIIAGGALGTPSSGLATNLTGTASGLTAGNVTTNANLTGGVTSVGNTTTVITNANLTGNVTSVGNTTTLASIPVISGANLTSLTAANISAGTAGISVTGNAGTVTNGVYTTNKDASGGVAGLTLFKLNLRNAANTITSFFTTAATVARTWTLPDKDGTVAMTSDITGTNSGTNTGDQTITLTGGVTGSGTGSFAATVITNANLTGGVTSVGNAATVVTNANLTGVVTSTGNATAIADTALSIAKTSGLQAALDGKQPIDAALTALAAGSDFVQFTGPASTTKIFTLPDASSTILVSGGALGTPSSGVATNLTGTASGLTAGNVTTNANLTGDVTSSGNATTLTNAPVIAKVLTGYVSGAGVVAATDSILAAIQKLNGNDTGGTVTAVSVATANGVSGSSSGGATPALTIALDAITPSAVQVSGLTASQILSTDASKNLTSLAVATYPSLTELAYVKGVTSAIQTQINTKGVGTVTSASVVSANGFAGTVATATSTPAITLTTSITGVLKGNATAISAATAGTDYSLGTSALATGIVKSTTTTGALTIAVAGDFPTLNQTTTGSAATLTTPRAIYGNNFDGSAALTQIIASTYGGTGNGFSKFSGAATTEKTYTLPNATTTILTTNSAVTEVQGGTNQTTYTTGDLLYASAANTLSKLSAGTVNCVLTSGGAGVAPSWAVRGATGAGGDTVFQENSVVVTTNYTLTTAKNASSVGPITINGGITVTVPSGARWVIL